MLCADNRRVMRTVDLALFSIFDLGSFGLPWVQAIIIADRRRVAAGELLGLVLTEGAGLAYAGNGNFFTRSPRHWEYPDDCGDH
jgi:hypothetical protein